MLRFYYYWLAIGWLMVVSICYVSLTPSPPEIDIGFKHLDKIEHLSAYFILMFWFSLLYEIKSHRLIFVLFFVVMGVGIEILQGLGGVRYFEYYDMLANSLGVALAWLITKRRTNNLLLSIENKFLR